MFCSCSRINAPNEALPVFEVLDVETPSTQNVQQYNTNTVAQMVVRRSKPLNMITWKNMCENRNISSPDCHDLSKAQEDCKRLEREVLELRRDLEVSLKEAKQSAEEANMANFQNQLLIDMVKAAISWNMWSNTLFVI